MKYAIDRVVRVSGDFNDFPAKCAEYGILIEYNPEHKIDLKSMLAKQKERTPVQKSRGQKHRAGIMKPSR